MKDLIEVAQTAEIIAVPTGRDAEPCRQAFESATGIEIPEFPNDRLNIVTYNGKTFCRIKSKWVPVLVTAGKADAGVVGTDWRIELNKDRSLAAQKIGNVMCRYSLLAKYWALTEIAAKLSLMMATEPLKVPCSRPRLLRECARALEISLDPGLVLESSTEIAADLEGSGVVADIVDSGQTARQHSLDEVVTLCQIYPEVIVSTQSLDPSQIG